MTTVTVARGFQVVLPKSMRESLSIRPGQKFVVIVHDGRAELIPLRAMETMRGFLRGIDTQVPRDKKRC